MGFEGNAGAEDSLFAFTAKLTLSLAATKPLKQGGNHGSRGGVELTPEEVWSWLAHLVSQFPALCFSLFLLVNLSCASFFPPLFLSNTYMFEGFNSRVCGNGHGMIRKYGINTCRQCFRIYSKDIGFVKVGCYSLVSSLRNPMLEFVHEALGEMKSLFSV